VQPRPAWKIYLNVLSQERAYYITGALTLAATTALASILPMILRAIIREIERAQTQGAAALPPTVTSLSLWLLGAALLMAGVRVISRLALLGGGRRVGLRLRSAAFARLMLLGAPFYARHSTGDLSSRLTSDVTVVQSVCGPGLMYFTNAILIYASCLACMLSIDLRLSLIVFLPYPFLLAGVAWAAEHVKRHSKLAQEATGRLTSSAHETLTGISVVKGLTIEDQRISHFRAANDEALRENIAQGFQRALIQLAIGLASGATVLVVLWFGGKAVVAGTLQIADFVAFLSYVGLLVQPTVYFGWVVSLLARGGPALERVQELIDAPEEITDPPNGYAGPMSGALSIRQLSYSYPSPETSQQRRAAITNLSLELPAGQSLGLFGKVGSGKSTLLRLLNRLLESSPGSIAIDGHPIETWSLDALRKGAVIVPQDGQLFSLSLRENIALGRPEASDDEILSALELAGFVSDLDQLPAGLDTLVGERGVMLSGGQRQRVALARALLMNPRILLLDDSFSMIDLETAAGIMSRLSENSQNQTIIHSAHRTASLLDCHEILVLERGELAERGSPQSLLASGGIFAQAHERQAAQARLEQV
jgi:ATP-binding cassette subfamily B multidrug efflux pump